MTEKDHKALSRLIMYDRIKHYHEVEHRSIRWIARKTNLNFRTIKKYLEMDQKEYRGCEKWAIDILQDWDLQCYLERQGIRLGQDLHPVGGADLADYWETLNKWDLETFLEQEVYR